MQNAQQQGIPEIIAEIPGVLGYYPSESLIIVLLHEHITLNEEILTSHNPTTTLYTRSVQLDPIIRIDLAHTDKLGSLAGIIHRYTSQHPNQPTFAIGVIVSEHWTTMDARTSALCTQLISKPEHLIECIYHVPAINSRRTFTLLHKENFPSTALEFPHTGKVADIGNAESYKRKTLEYDDLPAISKEKLAELFYPQFCEDDVANAERLNDRRDILRKALKMHKESIHSLQTAKYLENQVKQAKENGAKYTPHQLHRAQLILRNIKISLNVVAEANCKWDEIKPAKQDALLIKTASQLMTNQDRDLLIETVLEHPKEAMRLFIEVAKATYLGDDPTRPIDDHEPLGELGVLPVRANALSLYALAAMEYGRNDMAMIALQVAEKDHPAHNLSAMLLQALRKCVPPEEIVNVVEQGSIQTLEELRRHAMEGFSENPIVDPYSGDEVQF